MDQVFAIRLSIEKCLEKDMKLHVALMDLEKAYDRISRSSMRVVLFWYR